MHIATTGTYSVNPGGLAKLNLAWNTATGDADQDTNCSTLNAQVITEHTGAVLEAEGAIFDFEESVDIVTSPTISTDTDVQSRFVGTCKRQ
jgi:hypothetical protein